MSLHPFRVVGITARLLLVAFAWKCRPQHVQQDPKTPSVINFGQDVTSTGCVAHDRSGWSAPAHSGVDVVPNRRELPRITRPQHIGSIGAHVPRPSLDELIEKRVVRYQQWGGGDSRRRCSQSVLSAPDEYVVQYQLLLTEQWEACIVGDTCLSCVICEKWANCSPCNNMCVCVLGWTCITPMACMYKLLCMFTMLFWHLLRSIQRASHYATVNAMLCYAKPVSVSARYCIPQCVRLIAGVVGGGGRVGRGVHDGYTFPVQTDGVFYFPWHRHQIEGTNGFWCL